MHRRRFIQFASKAALGTMMAPLLAGRGSLSYGEPAGGELQIACIGLGNQMRGLLEEALKLNQDIVALCDVDPRQIVAVQKAHSQKLGQSRAYSDYRQLFDDVKSLDAVIIATPDHWHAAICKEAIKAGKHVYCEKPLAHTVGEARYIGSLAKKSKIVTQTGNQGSASSNFRRSLELIQNGVIGQVTEIHIWHPKHDWPSGVDRPIGADPVPAGFDWNYWLGPAPVRSYKTDLYHPQHWRGWYDFGGGSLSDFCCHAFSLPVRALDLDYPNRIEVSGVGLAKDSFPKSCTVHFHFAARQNRGQVSIYFYTGGDLPAGSVTAGIEDTLNKIPRTGCLIQGDKGSLSAGLWNNECNLKMKGESDYTAAQMHDAAKNVPRTVPRAPKDGHMLEWVEACKGNGKTFSPFEFGGHVTEIGAAGLIALRLGHDIDWDGAAMKAKGTPGAAALVKPQHRAGWGV